MRAAQATRERCGLMAEWRPFRDEDRPLPDSVATPFVWAAALAGAMLTVGVLGARDGLTDPLHALLMLCALPALGGECPLRRVPPWCVD